MNWQIIITEFPKKYKYCPAFENAVWSYKENIGYKFEGGHKLNKETIKYYKNYLFLLNKHPEMRKYVKIDEKEMKWKILKRIK